jgi:hypothetical protein
MKLKSPSEEYLDKAKRLSDEEAERLLARMRGRFSRRMEDKTLSLSEALALQLEHEDEELDEWRARMAEIKRLHQDAEVAAGSGQ